jgi:hypothetical protein
MRILIAAHRYLIVSSVLWLGLAATASEGPPADLVVVGNIATMSAARPHAGGMAIAGGRSSSSERPDRPGGFYVRAVG